ncbi:MAG: hypothetical protein AUH82_00435 [Chloroflexi bacterium 13_1_40CM_4_65_13]|nr:MAG: hypothetical protein AUH82_00435 [Chloroflexi bacterium 13_1_40CM_4_65_13]
MTSTVRVVVASALAALGACAVGRWRSQVADDPLTRSELSSRNLSVTDETHDSMLHAAFVRALAREGFTIAAHPPYHEDLEVTLTVVRAPEGVVAVATLRSDGFFIDEARASLDGADAALATLARTLALSQGTADFVRNSGTPQQKGLSGQ